MNLKEITYYYNKFKFGEDNYHNLMKKRVHEILLVSTFYDAYIFEQDGRLSEQIWGEYQQLNLSTAPRITSVPTGEGALRLLETKRFDLVISGMRIGDLSPFDLAAICKQKYPDMPVLLLANIRSSGSDVDKSREEMQYVDNVFAWQGDSKIFLAMVKYVEDRMNVAYDTDHGLVRVILLVEDSINYYSRYLPLLYNLIVRQTQHLITIEVNDINKRLRMRARPKVILCHTYEEAVEMYEKYRSYISAVISDVSYPRQGKQDNEAGFKLINYVRYDNPTLPVLLQSADDQSAEVAREMEVTFANKYSKSLLYDVQGFILKRLGFGEFTFRLPNSVVIDRASTISEFEKKLAIIPEESLLYHSQSNDFSAWLHAHGEFAIAATLASQSVTDFASVAELRAYLLNSFQQVRNRRMRGKIINFRPEVIEQDDCVIRLTEGSLGGKGRGIAFLNGLLVAMEFDERYPDIYIRIPTTFIVGTSEFDLFLEANGISESITVLPDEWINKVFMSGHLSKTLRNKLRVLLEHIDRPLAIRSSGLLEDSQALPFAGVYQTYMIPNNHPKIEVRLEHLVSAIKLVYASVYKKTTRDYIEGLNYQVEEEKMAVIIEEVAGHDYDGTYYPHISGVAQSYNYYATKGFSPQEGVCALAVGLGRTVVEGGTIMRFIPSDPGRDILSEKEVRGNSQKRFYALDLTNQDFDLAEGEGVTYSQLTIKEAEPHGTLPHLVSTWDNADNRLVEGIYGKGPRIVTFANILKYNIFPLPAIIKDLLEIGETAMGVPVEIEFAVDLTQNTRRKIRPNFYVLQIRPLTVNPEETKVEPNDYEKDKIVMYSENSMGNGSYQRIADIVFVDPDVYDSTQTVAMTAEIERINALLREEKRPYLLIAPGRWGSSDRFLGIPVRWDQINAAKLVVEITKENYNVDSSQGTHFFHNLISQDVGYVAISHQSQSDLLNWDWLRSLEPQQKMTYFTHVALEQPLKTVLDGRKSKAIVVMP